MGNSKNWEKVKEDFIKEYNQDNDDFLLFDLAHANENAHTRVLLKLLNYNNHCFLPSFLKQIGLPDCLDLNSILISDQKPAIPESTTNSASGYIDLYLRYQDKDRRSVYVIIENKICGAGDTKRQLARYVATVEKGWDRNDGNFDTWYGKLHGKNIPDNINNDIRVVYLTADGNKEPNEGQEKDDQSLPENLKKILEDEGKYYPKNYRDDILPWLEEFVMPEIPYSSDGMMIAGVRQYITYLKKMFITETTSKCLKEYFEGLENDRKSDPVKLYETIDENIKEIEEDIQKDDKKKKNERENPNYDALKQLANNLEYYKRKIIFKDYAPEGWELYFTHSFILLYKGNWWSEYDRKKNYNFPSIHFNLSPTDNFFDGNKTISWCIKGVKIPISEIKKDADYKDGWILKGDELVKKLTIDKVDIKRDEDYFKKCINGNINNLIKTIDRIISEAKDEKYQVTLYSEYKRNCDDARSGEESLD